MKLHVLHETLYGYDQPIRQSIQMLRMTPPSTPSQQVHHWHLEYPGKATPWTDAYGNLCHCLILERPVQEIKISAHGEVSLNPQNAGDAEGPIPHLVFLKTTALTQINPAICDFLESFKPGIKSRPYMGLHDLMMGLLERMPYQKGVTHVGDTAAQAFEKGHGVCQDHTHVFLSCARHLGIPARYVSGYLHDPSLEQVASHAWAEAWVGSGWVGFDVSNAAFVAQRHVRLAHGLDYSEASPVRGLRVGGGQETLTSYAKVESIDLIQQ
jgi:transglutaminase-like putative cysteine protease